MEADGAGAMGPKPGAQYQPHLAQTVGAGAAALPGDGCVAGGSAASAVTADAATNKAAANVGLVHMVGSFHKIRGVQWVSVRTSLIETDRVRTSFGHSGAWGEERWKMWKLMGMLMGAPAPRAWGPVLCARLKVFFDGFVHAEFEGIGDEGVADGDFGEEWNVLD